MKIHLSLASPSAPWEEPWCSPWVFIRIKQVSLDGTVHNKDTIAKSKVVKVLLSFLFSSMSFIFLAVSFRSLIWGASLNLVPYLLCDLRLFICHFSDSLFSSCYNKS